MILQLGTNFVTFLDKLTDMFERIADILPTYHAHIQRIRELPYPASRLRLGKALSYVYADIIQFCQSAYGLLCKRRGNRKYPLWTSFYFEERLSAAKAK